MRVRHAHPPRGFTLIEAMVIISTLGLLVAVGVATYHRATAKTPPYNAAKDLVDQLERARSRAVERKNDVWVIVYPSFNKKVNSTSAGRGAYFVFEDAKGDFNAATGGGPNVHYRRGVGREFDPVAQTVSGPNGKVLESIFLEDYPGEVRLRLQGAQLQVGSDEGLAQGVVITAACTFCMTEGRGAIVFSPDHSIRFVNNAGEPGSADRPQALTLFSETTENTSVVVVSASDGHIGAFQK